MHCGAPVPATQRFPLGHGALAEQPPPGVGLQTPRSHCVPDPQGFVASQPARHWPSAQTRPPPHSLENVQVDAFGVQLPATHTSVPVQSVLVAHAQGPSAPPQAWHCPATQVAFPAQSLRWLHSRGFGGTVVVGATHTFAWQTSPRGQAVSVAHFFAHPSVVHTESAPQTALLWQGALVGGGTLAQPRPSQV